LGLHQKFAFGAPVSVTGVVAHATPVVFVAAPLGVHVNVVLPFTVDRFPLDCVRVTVITVCPAALVEATMVAFRSTVPPPKPPLT
jgi:hypothetical protein